MLFIGSVPCVKRLTKYFETRPTLQIQNFKCLLNVSEGILESDKTAL